MGVLEVNKFFMTPRKKIKKRARIKDCIKKRNANRNLPKGHPRKRSILYAGDGILPKSRKIKLKKKK